VEPEPPTGGVRLQSGYVKFGLLYILLSITFDINISSEFLLPSKTNNINVLLLSPDNL